MLLPSTLKDAIKHQTEYWDFIEPYFTSDKEYEARFAAVMILGHFVKREYLKSIRRLESITQQSCNKDGSGVGGICIFCGISG